MQTTLVDSVNLFRLVHFFDILAAVVFAVLGRVTHPCPREASPSALRHSAGADDSGLADSVGHVISGTAQPICCDAGVRVSCMESSRCAWMSV